VLYVEEPVYDKNCAYLETIDVATNITVLRPHTMAEQAGFTDEQIAAVAALLREHLARKRPADVIAWFYTPLALPLLQQVGARAVIYDCMDELAAFKGSSPLMRQREAQLLQVADLVLTGGPSLYAAKRGLHRNVHCLPSAVDAEHFRPDFRTTQTVQSQEADRLQGHIGGPRLGFYGVVDERIDLPLLLAVATARPDWQLIMVGPVVKIDPATLPQAPNIHWLGSQPYSILPALVAGWDICLLPFALNEHTRFISPTKTLEYLAAQQPCVSTPIQDVVGMYGDVVAIATTNASFVAACESLLRERPADRTRRLHAAAALVARYSWAETAQTVQSLMTSLLSRRSNAPATAAMTHLESQVLS
jgi:glycosyltransferase involved in cell wall biosynthesis